MMSTVVSKRSAVTAMADPQEINHYSRVNASIVRDKLGDNGVALTVTERNIVKFGRIYLQLVL